MAGTNARESLDEHVERMLSAMKQPESTVDHAAEDVTAADLLELFDAQAGSRQLDFAARRLAADGYGFYSIGSAGHESNAAVAAALRLNDPVLPHYRSGALYLHRAGQSEGHDPIRDVLLGVVASAEEPIAGGRHKVFGHRALHVIPTTSTIASHLPRAMGLAFALGRAGKLGLACDWPSDAIVTCSFGDASANHSTALGALNAARYCAHSGLGMPLLLVCEDNGWGISVPTPPNWIAATHGGLSNLRYFAADGSEPVGTLRAAREAVAHVRRYRAPAFLHLRTVRYLGHAGSDVELAYRDATAISDDYRHDPLLGTARALVDAGVRTPRQMLTRYRELGDRVRRTAEEVIDRPRLSSAAEVMAPLHHPEPSPARPGQASDGVRRTLAQGINTALAELLDEDTRVLVFGEDVARKGGVYGVTRGLRGRFGAARVFDTLLDEQSILGIALGAGLTGFLPIPEVQYLAYLHHALDQIRAEAATMPFFATAQYRNPLVVRVPGYAYQRGFGGHFHNDNSVAALRDIPGLVIASPSRADDAAAMLRTCVAAGKDSGRICAFLEPIALYHTRDLHEEGDEGWLAECPVGQHAELGRARCHGDGADVALVTFGNGVAMCQRVARRLSARGVRCRVLDLRWLSPLPTEDVLRAARACEATLVVDETRRSGGVSEAVLTALIDAGHHGRVGRVTSEDSFIPLGPAAQHVLLDENTIAQAALNLLGS